HTIISSHGTAIATILAAFDKQFGLDDFQRIKTLFPFVAVLQFDHRQIQSIQIDNIFTGECHARYLI
ncbi:histidine phosphatase family protein, partial [Streptococcus pluranimalium]